MRKKKERLYTLLIAPNGSGKVRQFKIFTHTVYFWLFLLIACSLAFSYAVFRYVYSINRLGNYEKVVAELNRVKEENQVFREKTASLSERVTHIQMLAKSVSRLTGIDINNPESATGGIGGFGIDTWKPYADARDLGRLRQLGKETESVTRQINALKSAALEQSLFVSALPSAWPVRGYISSAFGGRPDPMSGSRQFHTGMDIAAPTGAKVAAPADGTVVFAGAQQGYGYTVLVSHRYGLVTRYAHLSSFSVRPGVSVRKGDVLGYIGSTGRSTGPHLHYEIQVHNTPVNPLRFLMGKRTPS